MKQKHKELVEVAALAGIILLEAHAESFRVEDCVRRILETSGLTRIDVISNSTGLFITLDDESNEVEPYTIIRRVYKRGNHLNKVHRVNSISRLITQQKISISEAKVMLEQVCESEYSVFSKDIGTILMAIGFTIILGGNLFDVLISFIAGGIIALSRYFKLALQLNSFMSTSVASFLTVFFTNIICRYTPAPTASHIIIISALMPLYPGIAFTNALKDTLKGDFVSGLARLADAIVIALSIALGVACGLSTFKELF